MMIDISKKTLQDYHLPIDARELRKAQLSSPDFSDIMAYLEGDPELTRGYTLSRELNHNSRCTVQNMPYKRQRRLKIDTLYSRRICSNHNTTIL